MKKTLEKLQKAVKKMITKDKPQAKKMPQKKNGNEILKTLSLQLFRQIGHLL